MWVVEFHADGGQCCKPGVRTFENEQPARDFFDQQKNDTTHYCKDHCKIYESDDPSIKSSGITINEFFQQYPDWNEPKPRKLTWWERLFG